MNTPGLILENRRRIISHRAHTGRTSVIDWSYQPRQHGNMKEHTMPKNNKYKVIKEDTERSWRNVEVGDVLELVWLDDKPDEDGDLYFMFPSGLGGYYKADCVEMIDGKKKDKGTVTVKVDASGLRDAIEGVSLRHAALSLVIELVKNARFPEMGVPTAAPILAHAKAFEDYLLGGVK